MEAGNCRKFFRELKVDAVRMASEENLGINLVSRDRGIYANVVGHWKRQL